MINLNQILWQPLKGLPTPTKLALKFARFVFVIFRDINQGQVSLRSMSLVYTTILSFVPLLALSFSVLKAFGVHNQVEPLLLGFLEPMGAKGIEITTQIISFVENMKVGVLGAVGLGMLIYTVISLVQKIETAFNHIWRIKSTRPISQRFSGYLSVIVISPVLIFSAIGLSTAVMEGSLVQQMMGIESLGGAITVLGKTLPTVFTILVFTLFYLLIPNTRVKAGSALVGGLVSGIAWKVLGLVFASFATGSSHYDAVYSGFAVIIFSMIWLYLNWLIVLLGASISFYHQHPEHVKQLRDEGELSPAQMEAIAFDVVKHITSKALVAEKAPTLEQLTSELNYSRIGVESALSKLVKNNILTTSDHSPCEYLLSAAPQATPITKLWHALRGKNADKNQHVEAIEKAVEKHFKGKTLMDL